MKKIRINHPGDGQWIMEQVEGFFQPGFDHSITSHEDGELLGGFALTGYLGNSMTVHQAGKTAEWCSRPLLWAVFGYAFRQLKCHKIFAPVPSDNYHAMDLCLRAGWRLENVVSDAYAPGRHLMLLAMEAGTCPWLRLKTPPSYLFDETTTVVENC